MTNVCVLSMFNLHQTIHLLSVKRVIYFLIKCKVIKGKKFFLMFASDFFFFVKPFFCKTFFCPKKWRGYLFIGVSWCKYQFIKILKFESCGFELSHDLNWHTIYKKIFKLSWITIFT